MAIHTKAWSALPTTSGCDLTLTLLKGEVRTRSLPITVPALTSGLFSYQQGKLIQNAFPDLSVSEREFLMTGMSDQEWTDLWGEEE